MPELPEVETVRRRLLPHVAGKAIRSVEVRDTRLVGRDDPRRVEQRLAGRTLITLDRRGKYLLLRLDGGETLISHLRMTGNWLVVGGDEPPHTRAVITLADGTAVAYADARRFGTWDLLTDADAAAYLAARLGPEPIDADFDGAVLQAAFRGRQAPVKALLLDQRLVAGIGNIYADEALFRAEVHPLREAGRLRPAQYELLARTIQEALQAGLDAGGATIDDFRHADGLYGSFQDEFLVHRRAGRPCPRCGTEIEKIVVAGRGTYVCRSCQARPRGSIKRRAAPRASHSGLLR